MRAWCISDGTLWHIDGDRPPEQIESAFAQEVIARNERQRHTQGWKTAQPRETEPRGSWWTVFNDPQLDAKEAEFEQWYIGQKAKVAELFGKALEIENQIYQANQPVPHKYELALVP